tara:strand:- start:124 stop:426 length:303 start_codon:yes stop_codon:yes gene_type:complete
VFSSGRLTASLAFELTLLVPIGRPLEETWAFHREPGTYIGGKRSCHHNRSRALERREGARRRNMARLEGREHRQSTESTVEASQLTVVRVKGEGEGEGQR